MPEQVRQTTMQVSLDWLVHMAEIGRLRPAPFSRPQVWSARQVADLFDSIYRGYPIGTLLVIEQPADEEDVLLGNALIHAPSDERALILIDGLQRVTAIVGSLSRVQDQSASDRFQICYDFKRDKFITGPPAKTTMLPLNIAFDGRQFGVWMREHPFLTDEERDACWRLSDALKTYSMQIIILAGADAWSTAREIFTRINASGATLTRSDLARARSGRVTTAKSGLERLQIETERSGFGLLSIELAAQCALNAIREPVGSLASRPIWARPQQTFEQLSTATQQHAIDHAQSAMIPAIEFLRQKAAIPHVRLLPQSAILPNLVRFIDIYGPPAGRPQELLKRWAWRFGTISDNSLIQPINTHGVQETALDAATHLLDSLPQSVGPDWRPDMSVASLNYPHGRINTLALLSLRPPLLVPPDNVVGPADVLITAPPILIPWLNEVDSTFCELLPWKFTERRPTSLGSYLLHPPAEQRRLMEAVMSKHWADADLLSRHCIDRKALNLLVGGGLDEFVEYRERKMSTVILDRVRSMARWGFRDHGNLPSISDNSQFDDRYGDEY